MKLFTALFQLKENPDYKDGCTRHINCTNVRDVLLSLQPNQQITVMPNYMISDWTGDATVYSYCNGHQR